MWLIFRERGEGGGEGLIFGGFPYYQKNITTHLQLSLLSPGPFLDWLTLQLQTPDASGTWTEQKSTTND